MVWEFYRQLSSSFTHLLDLFMHLELHFELSFKCCSLAGYTFLQVIANRGGLVEFYSLHVKSFVVWYLGSLVWFNSFFGQVYCDSMA